MSQHLLEDCFALYPGDLAVDYGYWKQTAESPIAGTVATNTDITILPHSHIYIKGPAVVVGWRYEVHQDQGTTPGPFYLSVWRMTMQGRYTSVGSTFMEAQDFTSSVKYLNVSINNIFIIYRTNINLQNMFRVCYFNVKNR